MLSATQAAQELARQSNSGLIDIPRNLFAERVDGFEALLPSEPSFEAQIDLNSVEVAREVDDMGLGNKVSAISKSRAIADIRDHRQEFPLPFAPPAHASQAAEIDAGCGENLGLRSQVRGRKTDRSAATVAFGDLATRDKRPTEQGCRFFDLPLPEQLADPSRIQISTLNGNFRYDGHGKAEMRSSLGQHAHRALPILSKMKVVADVDLNRPDGLVQIVLNEMLRRVLGEFQIERLRHDRIEPERFEGLHLLLEGFEQAKIRRRLQDPARMGLEGIENRLPVERFRAFDHLGQDRLVPAMHAVEIADRHHGAGESARQLGNASKNLQRGLRAEREGSAGGVFVDRDCIDVAVNRRGAANRSWKPAWGAQACYDPSVRILSHYFIARFLGLFTLVLAAALLVLATIELVLNLDDVSTFGSSSPDASASAALPAFGHTLRYLGIRLTSYYLADLLPIASFVAVFLAFALAARAMELRAVEAGGIPPIRMILPVLATAGVLSLGAAILHETVILPAEKVWSGGSPDENDELSFGREAFWYQKGPMITNVAYADPETRELFDVEIFERSPNGAISRVIRTQRVEILDGGRWHINSADVWRFDAHDPESQPRIEKGVSLELDLEALRTDMFLGADPTQLPLPVLARYLEANPNDTSSTLRRIRARFHERLSSPWLVLVFAWLAIPFAFRVDERGRIAGPAVAAVVTIALFFVAQSIGQTLAHEAVLPVGWTPWVTMLLFSIGAAFALRMGPR